MSVATLSFWIGNGEVFVRRIVGDGPCQRLQRAFIHCGAVISFGFVLAHTPAGWRKAAHTRASTISEQYVVHSDVAKVFSL